jgi:hypothetical protein
MDSFSVRCLFRCRKKKFNKLEYLYEERITAWRAKDLDDALDQAIEEAKQYAAKHEFEYLGLAQGFWMFTAIEAHGVEVFSLMRESDLPAEDYLDAFFSTGHERQMKGD